MTLRDQDIIDLADLCGGAVDQTLSEAQAARLSIWISESAEARRFYVRMMGLSASLCAYAGEMQADEADLTPHTHPTLPIWRRPGALALAAVALISFSAVAALLLTDWKSNLITEEFVAHLTGMKDCRWNSDADSIVAGSALRKGQILALESGTVEVTFDCGAKVALTGPAVLELNSAWDATLIRGKLTANVPPEAIGFRIANPAVEVVDLGTEFSVVTDENGVSEVFVLKGTVEAVPSSTSNAEASSIIIKESEARRFSISDVSTIDNPMPMIEQFSLPVAFERPNRQTGYLHWPLDQALRVQTADQAGMTGIAPELQLLSVGGGSPALESIAGKWDQALKFKGSIYGKSAMRGVMMPNARTVAFWMRLPAGADLSNSHPMVAWRMGGRKNGPIVQVGWNRSPKDGELGVLRTDLGKGYTLGSTQLRDGQWHHIAIVLLPGGENDSRLQLNQYVDGKLERSVVRGGKLKITLLASEEPVEESSRDAVWVGHRPGAVRRNQKAFRGDLDEIFVVNRPLLPHEIVGLMNTNKLSLSELAQAP